ncbi:MAG: MFS transporter [Candidatus Nanopelagicaceae bacterium]|jgi:MFS family permease|nr:MFS transporter [Candidatus Nanopelagicaceae bacterium]
MGTLRSFKHRNFKILFSANFLSNIGTWAQGVAQAWLILELTDSGTYLGIVTSLQFAPILFFSISGGKIADKFNKRKVLMLTNLTAGISALSVATLVLTENIKIWHVMFFAFMLGMGNAIDAPVRQSFNVEVVGKQDLPNAVGLNSTNFNIGRLIGPGLSGLLIAAYGTGVSFLLNGISYLVVIIALINIRESELFIEEKKSSSTKIREAMAYVAARPDILAVMITVFFATSFGLNFNIFNTMMATQVFDKGAAEYGALGSILAVGSLSGAIISARLEKKRGPRFVMIGSMIFSAILILSAFAPTYLVYSILLPIIGCVALLTFIGANTMVQLRTDSQIRGRVMGIYLTVFLGGTPIVSPFIGIMTQEVGTRPTVAICGLISLLAAIATFAKFKDKGQEPDSFAIADVLEPTYENKKD